jgi:hypothetical protein
MVVPLLGVAVAVRLMFAGAIKVLLLLGDVRLAVGGLTVMVAVFDVLQVVVNF